MTELGKSGPQPGANKRAPEGPASASSAAGTRRAEQTRAERRAEPPPGRHATEPELVAVRLDDRAGDPAGLPATATVHEDQSAQGVVPQAAGPELQQGVESDPPRSSEAAPRALVLPPEPPSGCERVVVSSPIINEQHHSDAPLAGRVSSPFFIASLYPDMSRDTDFPRSTELGVTPEAAPMRDRAVLLRIDGSEAGEVHSLTEETIQIGRQPTTEIPVQDHGVSRVHARVSLRDGVHIVEDLGSRNGTYVQGRRIESAALSDGDTLQLGPRVLFRYTLVDARQEELLRQLYSSSKRDALTGIYNRQHFGERLAAELSFAQRHNSPAALIMFDLDHFKKVNDTFGHPAGDAVLRHVAGIVAQRLRTEDVFARVGGEEFMVLLRGADLRSAGRVAERMRVAVSTAPAHFEGQRIPVSISLGCASLTCCAEPTGESLIEVADRRLYAAKNAGRNRVVATG